MPAPKLSEAEFLAAWQQHGNATRMAAAIGTSERVVNNRRQRLRAKGHDLPTRPEAGYESRAVHLDAGWTFPRQREMEIDTGSVVVFSDCHYWPGNRPRRTGLCSTVIKDIKPRAIIANGDIFDGGSIGRHDPFGWAEKPSVKQELEACQERLGEVELAAPKGCELAWNIGIHDQRFERGLVTKVPDYANLHGMRLEDHFDRWDMRWSTAINWNSHHPVMVKHRHASGVHAGYNNSLKGGVTIVTGHTHQLEAKPYSDYRGRRWGVQCGSLAEHEGPQFEYAENGPSLHCSGFAVLTFRDGELTPPELCEVINGRAWFRGETVA